MRQRLMTKRVFLIGGAFFVSLAVILTSIFLFYKVYASPERVFWSMVNNNLATDGITKESVTVGSGTTSDDILQMGFSPEVKVRDVKIITSTTKHSQIQLETIGTVSTDYERYLNIKNPGSKATAAQYQTLYSMWLKSSDNQSSQPQAVNNALFGALLFGNFDSAQRSKLLTSLKSSYIVDFADVARQNVNSRRLYTYDVLVPLNKYAMVAHDYALAKGLPVASQIDPAAYSDSTRLHVKITVDVLSRQVVKIEYVDQGINESYSGYGIQPAFNAPLHTVSQAEFEKAVNAVTQ